MEELKEKLRAALGEGQARYAALNPRERVMVLCAAAAALTFFLFFIFFSLTSGASATERRTSAKLLKLAEVQQLAGSFREAQAQRDAAQQSMNGSPIGLTSYLEETGKRAGLDIPTMNPKGDVALGDDGKITESSVELTLTDITLPKLVDFLSSVERGPGVVKVKYLRIEPRATHDVLTAWATVSTYHLKGTP